MEDTAIELAPENGSVTLETYVIDDQRKYKMDHGHRGVAIIFNHTSYNVSGLAKRKGAKRDCDLLKKCFSALGFTYRKYKNIKLCEILNILKKVSEEDHSDRDCLVVTVLTHGENGLLYAYDTSYKEEELWLPFTKCTARSKTLHGKPKLFFIQACRGYLMDPGFKLHCETNQQTMSNYMSMTSFEGGIKKENDDIELNEVQDKTNANVDDQNNSDDSNQISTKVIETKNSEENNQYEIKNSVELLELGPDFLIAFATIPGYVAWKENETRAWFIQKLCEELTTKDDSQQHLLNILTTVSRRVAIECESVHYDDKTMHGKKQMLCITNTLTKLLYFEQN